MASGHNLLMPKRPSLQRRSEVVRDAGRTATVLNGTCRAGDRVPEDVLILDLSATGCRLQGLPVGITKSETLMLELGNGGGNAVAARLKWARKGAAGLVFDQPLDEAALQQLSAPPALASASA